MNLALSHAAIMTSKQAETPWKYATNSLYN